MKEFLFGRINGKLNKDAKVKNAESLAAVTHTHTHTHCLLVNNFCVFFDAAKLKLNRVFKKGSIAPLSFWHGGAGLSFSVFASKINDVVWCKGAARFSDSDSLDAVVGGGVCGIVASSDVSGLKSREGPFVGFRNVFVSKGTVLFDSIKIYERMCF